MAGHGDGREELSGLGYFEEIFWRKIVECNRRMEKFLEYGRRKGRKEKEGREKKRKEKKEEK